MKWKVKDKVQNGKWLFLLTSTIDPPNYSIKYNLLILKHMFNLKYYGFTLKLAFYMNVHIFSFKRNLNLLYYNLFFFFYQFNNIVLNSFVLKYIIQQRYMI